MGLARGSSPWAAAGVAAFFVVVFFRFAHPLADGDLWWHLNTGRWIVEHRALPQEDPFTYTVTAAYADRARMFVRSNWLAQVSYYAVYQALGLGGLRAWNAALFTLIVYVLYRTLRLQGLRTAWGLLLTAPCAAFAWHYDELRPFGFSVLFVALFVWLFEQARLQPGGVARERALIWLVPLAVLWANMHRGFPLMVLLLAPMALVWLARRRYGDALWLAAAGAASLLNPGGIRPVLAAFAESFQGTESFHIMELARPWEFARLTGPLNPYLPLLVLILGTSLAFMAVQWRRLQAEHVVLCAAFVVAGLTAFRYSIYLAVVATATSASYAALTLERPGGARPHRGVALALATVLAAMAWTSAPPTARAAYTGGLPSKGVSAMIENHLPGPLLNPFDWGGYIAWVAWPRYKVFIDSRLLDFTVFQELEGLAQGPKEPLLRAHGINTVIFPTLEPVQLRSSRLIRELMADPEWKLVYYDAISVVFVRRSAAPWAPEVSTESLGTYLLSVVDHLMRRRPAIAEDHFEAAAILRAMGRGPEADEAEARGRAQAKQAPTF